MLVAGAAGLGGSLVRPSTSLSMFEAVMALEPL